MTRSALTLLCVAGLLASVARADDAAEAAKSEELAKKLNNPVAALISVPFQENVDYRIGATNDGVIYKLNIQPVIPIKLNDDWNLISRTILPVVHWNKDVAPSEGTRFGLSDTTQSFFFSPAEPSTWGHMIWGFGPALLLPTATEGALGSQKWGAGPTVVLLKQSGPVTAGFLANQIWSFAGNDNRKRVNQTFFQPFLSYTTHTATSLIVNLESSYDWTTADWTIPANFMVQQVFKIGPQIMAGQIGFRSYLDAPPNGPSWGLRASLIFLFPK
jgi:hypothetical protein